MKPGERQELTGSLGDDTLFRASRHRHPSSPPELEQPFVAQDPKRTKDRIGVDLEDSGQVLRRRQAFSGSSLTLRDRAADFGRNLIVEGDRLRAIDLDMQHSAIHSSIMQTETAGLSGTGTGTEVLIPEARQHQRRRYRRRGMVIVPLALLIAALIGSWVLLLRGPAAGGKARSGSTPLAVAGAFGRVYFRPILCFAPAYTAPTGTGLKVAPRGVEPIPACTASSQLTATNLAVTPISPQGYSTVGTIAPDPQFAPYSSTSIHKTGYASSTVLLPGIGSACGSAKGRCVLGPAEMSGHSIGKATVKQTQSGSWVVDYSMAGSANAALWDKVAQENFHQLLGIELDGVVYSAPIIQPAQSGFSSFAGRGEISGGLSRSEAMQLARGMMAHKG